MNKLKHMVAVLSLLILACEMQAQGGGVLGGQDSLQLEYIRIEGIIDSDKPLPELPPVKAPEGPEPLSYEVAEEAAETGYEPAAPRALQPPKPVWPRLHNNMIRLGYGRFGTPLVDLYLNNGRNDDADFGLDFHHLSSSAGYLDYTEFREDYGTLKFSRFLKKHTFSADAFIYNTNYFYFADTLVADRPDLKDSIRQVFTRIDVNTSLKNHVSPEGVQYDVNLRFRDYFDHFENNELLVYLTPRFGWNVTEQVRAQANAELIFSNSKFYGTEQSRIFFDFTPGVKFNMEDLHVEAGLKINSFSDSTSEFATFPFLRASYELMPEQMTVYAGVDGQMKYNTFNDLITINRYLIPGSGIGYTKDKIHAFGGIKGKIGDHFSFAAEPYYVKRENQLIFYNFPEGAYFFGVYDTTFSETGLNISAMFSKDNKIRAGADFSYRSFTIGDTLITANYGVPNIEAKIWGGYNFADKVWASAAILIYGPRIMTTDFVTGTDIKQDAMADINLKVDYRFSQRVSVFLELNNILGNPYQRWYNYQERPLDIKGGLTLAF